MAGGSEEIMVIIMAILVGIIIGLAIAVVIGIGIVCLMDALKNKLK